MKKQLPLYILLVFLVIVNGFFLFKYLEGSGRKDQRGPKGPDVFLTSKLKFNENQIKQFNNLEDRHKKQMMSLSKEIRDSKNVLFDNISKDQVDDSVIDSITTVIGNCEKKKDLEVFQHFRAIYNICNDSQKDKFTHLVKNALHKGPPRRGKRPPNDMKNDKNGLSPRF